jgi:double-stranded uracil-DNA glycosylase
MRAGSSRHCIPSGRRVPCGLLRILGRRRLEERRGARREIYRGELLICPVAVNSPTTKALSMKYDSNILAEGLDVVFCGMNPASSAAAAGHNFSNRSNRFWTVLNLAGFTDVQIQPQEERRLLEYGCGITAIVSRPTRRAAEISRDEFKEARPTFEATIRRYAPRWIAILGKRAFSTMIGEPKLSWGPQRQKFAGAMIWVLPNPSGLNRSFTLDALVASYSQLRRAMTSNEPTESSPGRLRIENCG